MEGTHLHQCTVDVGGEEPLHIVCGAPNCEGGRCWCPWRWTALSLPGGVKIKKGKLRGMVSEGMLCSCHGAEACRTELYPNVGDDGPADFQRGIRPWAADVRPILGIDDYAVDFEILANRPDCLCACAALPGRPPRRWIRTFHAPKTARDRSGAATFTTK